MQGVIYSFPNFIDTMSEFEDSHSEASNSDTENDDPLFNLQPVAAAARPNVHQFQAPSGRI